MLANFWQLKGIFPNTWTIEPNLRTGTEYKEKLVKNFRVGSEAMECK